jgi:hypothetical protein
LSRTNRNEGSNLPNHSFYKKLIIYTLPMLTRNTSLADGPDSIYTPPHDARGGKHAMTLWAGAQCNRQHSTRSRSGRYLKLAPVPARSQRRAAATSCIGPGAFSSI